MVIDFSTFSARSLAVLATDITRIVADESTRTLFVYQSDPGASPQRVKPRDGQTLREVYDASVKAWTDGVRESRGMSCCAPA